ncbi:hypothetical protein K5D53_25310 [Pseudomonas cichorii]|nr:hypothetical protein [Pseudomonas cichorii]
MRSNFETALNKSEFPDYFRGRGIYFARDPDWGDHLHIINWEGLCGFLETQRNPSLILINAFEKYLNTVQINAEDAEDLFENLGCYYYMRQKTPILAAGEFDLVRVLSNEQKKKISEAIRFLHQELVRTNKIQDLEHFNRRMVKLINDGGPNDIENL